MEYLLVVTVGVCGNTPNMNLGKYDQRHLKKSL